MIQVFFFIYSALVSSTLANQIKSHLYTIPTTSICGSPLVIQNDNDCYKLNQSGWSSIVVNEGLCNSMTGSLSFSNNTCLQYIYIKEYSLKNINSLLLSISFFIFSTEVVNSFNSFNSLKVSSALVLSFQKVSCSDILVNSLILSFLLGMSKRPP